MTAVTSLTVIVPVYNEEEALESVLPPLIDVCKKYGWQLLIVNDGSDDKSSQILGGMPSEVRILTNYINIGYGASIKRAILESDTEWVASFDSDGQHRTEDLETFVANAAGCDAVLGVREKDSFRENKRVPGKWLLGKVTNLLVGHQIPDINCGLRVFRCSAIKEILSLTSNGFSFSTSTMIALLKRGYNLKFLPATVNKRFGKSSVRPISDGTSTLILIVRLIALFDPLRIMLPVSIFLFTLGAVYQIVSFIIYGLNIYDLTVLLCLSGVLVFVLALVVDQISALRRESTFRDHIDKDDK